MDFQHPGGFGFLIPFGHFSSVLFFRTRGKQVLVLFLDQPQGAVNITNGDGISRLQGVVKVQENISRFPAGGLFALQDYFVAAAGKNHAQRLFYPRQVFIVLAKKAGKKQIVLKRQNNFFFGRSLFGFGFKGHLVCKLCRALRPSGKRQLSL